MNAFGRLPTATYLEHVRGDAGRLADIVAGGPLDAGVPACPGWTLADLAAHVGGVHRWATAAAATSARPDERALEPAPDEGGEALAAWLRAGAERLLAVLGAADLDSPTWHPFPVPRTVAVWPRRQAQETAVHRWDAESAVVAFTPIDAELAGDGIDEYYELAVPRLVAREGVELPTGTLHVHCTDVDGEWLVWADPTGLHVRREHAKADAAVRGPAEAVLLLLWGRVTPDDDRIEVLGDADVAGAWLALPGL